MHYKRGPIPGTDDDDCSYKEEERDDFAVPAVFLDYSGAQP